jgi:hypothetical protein
MIGTPGKTLFATLPNTPVRCLWGGDNRLFAVGGSKLFEVLPNGTPVLLGDVGFATLPAQIFSDVQAAPGSGSELFIVSGNNGYVADGISVFQVVAASAGAFMDGYFIAITPNSNQFQLSALQDGTTWNGLQVAAKEGQPDRLTMILFDHETLWLFGEKTTEVWYDTGALDFPFQRIQGAFIEQGLWAPWSVAKLDNSIFWLGGDDRGAGVVWRAQGFLPVRISNHAVENMIRKYQDSYDAVAFAYQQNGHQFYVLSFPTGDATLVYDVATNMWHERAYWDPNAGKYHADLARCHAFTMVQNFVGDYTNGNIYVLDLDTYTDNGGTIRRYRSSPHIVNENKWVQYKRFILDTQVVQGPASGQGSNPQIILQFSDDGGFTWSNERFCGGLPIVPGQIQSLGQSGPGEYRFRYAWRRLGRSRDRCFRAIMTDPVQWIITDAYVEPGQGGF